jgi:ubiquinone/menaquinone biosynthesis C-methylase UbiE
LSFYERRVLPRLLHLVMQQENLAEYRRRVVPLARGRVLEIGIGSGLNLPLYGDGVDEVIGLDTSSQLLDLARSARSQSRVGSIDLIEGSAESVPIESASVDTVLTTWTLCSIPDARAALREMRRVLRPSGQLLFVEHGRAPTPGVRRWQDRLTPVWKRIAGGCHLNRPVSDLLEGAGFDVERVATGYTKGPKPMTFMYEGVARPRR